MKKQRGWKDMPRNPFRRETRRLPHDLWGVVTGGVRPWIKESAEAARFISKQEGFVAVHPMDDKTIWMFDSLNHAKTARNNIEAQGARCGTYISHFEVGDDGVPVWRGAE